MKLIQNGATLNVSELDELATPNSVAFQSAMREALPSEVDKVEIDLSQTSFVDCGGIGALVALRKCGRSRSASLAIRLINPTPSVRQIFNLTRMDRVFSIEPC
jgi:anti-sigma B factor antagonist